MKIYFKNPDVKSKTSLLESLYYSPKTATQKYSFCDYFGTVPTFIDQEFEDGQCHDWAYRSLDDLKLITKTYFKEDLNKEDFFKCEGYFVVFYCHDVEHVVIAKTYDIKYYKTNYSKNKNVFIYDHYDG